MPTHLDYARENFLIVAAERREADEREYLLPAVEWRVVAEDHPDRSSGLI